jgi:hypothetical protein
MNVGTLHFVICGAFCCVWILVSLVIRDRGRRATPRGVSAESRRTQPHFPAAELPRLRRKKLPSELRE